MKEGEKERKESKRETREQPSERQQSLAFSGLFLLGITGRRESMIGEVRDTRVCLGASVRVAFAFKSNPV